MTYLTGSVAAVPVANKQAYLDHLSAMRDVFRDLGATRMVETWGVDIPKGKVTDFHGAVEAGPDEAIVFGWIEWPDKAVADAAWVRMQNDPAMQQMAQMPFDGQRMIFGGFEPVLTEGQTSGGGYYQGFLLPVPEENKARYTDLAREVWPMFHKCGALGTVEAWGNDVPRGQRTDFYRATKAEPGDLPVFSWIVWPDRATCDAAAKSMEAEMAGMTMPEMPFDGMRMMWGGFEPLFDSKDAA